MNQVCMSVYQVTLLLYTKTLNQKIRQFFPQNCSNFSKLLPKIFSFTRYASLLFKAEFPSCTIMPLTISGRNVIFRLISKLSLFSEKNKKQDIVKKGIIKMIKVFIFFTKKTKPQSVEIRDCRGCKLTLYFIMLKNG